LQPIQCEAQADQAMKAKLWWVWLELVCTSLWGADVLIVADEFPAMRVLARQLQAAAGLSSELVTQTNLPAQLSGFKAVVVYVHGRLHAQAERALVDYTRAGGKLIPLHHSISSGKRTNQLWFPFLGVRLPEGGLAQGGYTWIEPVSVEFVCLAPDHFIMTNRVVYPQRIAYRRGDGTESEEWLPGFGLQNSEVYLNHTFTAPRTVLLGLKYTDAQTGRVYMQDRAGWVRPAGKGWIIYFQPGHSAADFENPAYAQILVNAVLFRP
jgi:hypothetical protein